MNRRDFLKSLPFIGALASAIFWREPPPSKAIAKSAVLGSNSKWSVVDLGQPVSEVIHWDNRIYAVGDNGDVWVSSDRGAVWIKVESGHIDSYIDSLHKT